MKAASPGSRRRRRLAAAAIAAAAIAASPARAQFDQFAQPGGEAFVSGGGEVGEQGPFDSALRNSRWRLGKLYLDPWVGLRDISYVDRIDVLGGERGDYGLTATAGAGLDTYLPLGEHMTWASHVSPLYVWFQDQEDRSRFNLDASSGLYGRMGRLGMELEARRNERLRLFSQEVPQQVNSRQDRGQLRLSFPLVGGFSLFGDASVRRFESLEDEETVALPFHQLDRDELVYAGGIAYRFRRGIQVQLGVGRSEVEFAEGGQPLDNRGDALILRVDHGTEWIGLYLDLAYRELEPLDERSEFRAFSGVSGATRLQWRLGRWIAPEVFYRRNLVYSLREEATYLVDTRYGLAVRSQPIRRLQLRAFVENGSNDYEPAAGAMRPLRSDDVFTYGASAATRVGWLNAGVTAYRSHYDSNLPGFDRSVTVVQSHISMSVGVRLGGDLIWD